MSHKQSFLREQISAVYLYGSTQVDACFNSHIVRGLEESPLQE